MAGREGRFDLLPPGPYPVLGSVLTIHARPTTYSGIRMRSRLEASFAEMLDGMFLEWTYEGTCYASRDGQYLPDFHAYLAWRDDWEYCEVKPPNANFAEALEKMHIILASEPLARLGVWTKTQVDPQFKRVSYCLPDDPCGLCGREKLARGYPRT